jgi:hypothetical protein
MRYIITIEADNASQLDAILNTLHSEYSECGTAITDTIAISVSAS